MTWTPIYDFDYRANEEADHLLTNGIDCCVGFWSRDEQRWWDGISGEPVSIIPTHFIPVPPTTPDMRAEVARRAKLYQELEAA